MKKSEKLIRTALEAVSKDRPSTHGDASLNFKMTAILWNAYDQCVKMVERESNEVDVAQKMVLAKMARMLAGDAKFDDHYVDQIGYSALAGQLAENVISTYIIKIKNDTGPLSATPMFGFGAEK